MSTFTKSVISLAFVGAVLGTAAFFGLTPFGKQVITQLIGSPAGTTFNTAKFAGVAMNLASPGTNGTSSSILNGDASDRIITGVRYGCEAVGSSNTAYSGTGLAALTFSIATTSGAAPAAFPTLGNRVGGTNFTIATSAVSSAYASTTAGTNSFGVGTTSVVWAAGSFLTFQTNATNTATCTLGVDYIGS